MFIIILGAPFLTPIVRMPVIVIEILIGILLGYLGWINEHPTLDFFASFGLTYLLFLAGLEVDVSLILKKLRSTLGIAVVSVSLPFCVGFMIGNWLDIPAFLFGTIFSTTSLGIVLPMTREFSERKEFVQVLLGSVILIDIISMFLLAFSLSLIDGNVSATFVYSMLAMLTLFFIPWFINQQKIHEWVERILSKKVHFEREVRFSFALIFIFGAISESFGFHSIIGAFIAGLIISEITPDSSLIEEKLKGFGYGFFIPLFFILAGTRVDIAAIFNGGTPIWFLSVIVLAAVFSKQLGVAIVAKLEGFSMRESLAMGTMHSARLSLIIAAAEIARKTEIIDAGIYSVLVLIAVLTSTIAPTTTRMLLHQKSTG